MVGGSFFAAPQLQLKYDTNRLKFLKATPETVSTRGGKVQQPAPPSRYGYLFMGWYTELWSFEADTADVNLHLYAKWTKDESADRYTDVKKTDWFYGNVEYDRLTA